LLRPSFFFPSFSINNSDLISVAQFKYLGNMINNDFLDNDDIERETRNRPMFFRVEIWLRRHNKCSAVVKLLLFKTFCLCLYVSVMLVSDYISRSLYITRFDPVITDVLKCFTGYIHG